MRDLSDINLDNVITQTLRNVRNAYWDLSYSINNLKAQQESLALSRQSLKDNQKRVEIGTMAPIDIVQAQAEVATNESSVIVAEAAIKQAQDNLRALILDPGTPDFWNVAFEPSDAAAFDERAIDLDAAVRNAMDKRSDIRSAKNALEQSDINIKYYTNQIKPDVNANVGYNPVGIGGTQLSSRSTSRPWRRATCPTGPSSPTAASARCSATSSRAVPDLDVRRHGRLPARRQHRAREPGAGEAGIRPGAGHSSRTCRCRW